MSSAGAVRRRGAVAAERLTGVHSVLEALRARRRVLLRLLVAPASGGGVEQGHRRAALEAAESAGVPIERVSAEVLRGLVGEAPGNPQRLVLEAGPLPEVELSSFWESVPSPRRVVLLDGVEDPQNLGAIARVAEAAGVVGLIVTRRRSPPLGPAASRASAGALEWLPVARVANGVRSLKLMKEKGFWVLGADPTGDRSAFELEDEAVAGDLVVVLGAEGRGLRPGILGEVDYRVRIPTTGRVASLNVATAAAVLLFDLERRG